MQTRFQRLILDAQHGARFFRRQALNVPQHHWRAIDCRQRKNRPMQALAQLRFEQTLVGELRPVDGLAPLSLLDLVALVRRREALFFLRTLISPGSQPRHGRVEGDSENPRRQRCVAPELADLSMDLDQNVLRDFLRVFFVAQVSKRQLIDPGAIGISEFSKRLLVAPLQAGEKGVDGVVRGGHAYPCGCQPEPQWWRKYSRLAEYVGKPLNQPVFH